MNPRRVATLSFVVASAACRGAPATPSDPNAAAASPGMSSTIPSPEVAPAAPRCKDEPGMAFIPAGHTAFYSTRVDASEVDVDALWLDLYETTVG